MTNDDGKEFQFQIPQLSSEIVNHLLQRGYDVCGVAYYSTKPTDVLTGVIEEARRAHLPQDSLIDLVNFPVRFRAQRPEIQAHFVDGKYTFVANDSTRLMCGTYLRIVCPITAWEPTRVTDEEKNALLTIENCAAMISFLHGEFVTLERHFCAVSVISENKTITAADGVYVRQSLAGEPLNQALARIVDEERECDFKHNDTAMSLIRRAHREKDNSVKFLFMWLAVESLLGSGRDRKKFALEEMRSEALNNVLNELRTMRDSLVHDGQFIELTQKVYLRIKAVCIMGFTNNMKLRHRLLEFVTSELTIDSDTTPLS